jgi:hypothetical protein
MQTDDRIQPITRIVAAFMNPSDFKSGLLNW